MATETPALLPVGFVLRAHGVRGRLLLQPFNDASEGLERLGELWLSPRGAPQTQARSYQVTHAERVNLGYIVSLRGIEEKNAADALKGLEVTAERDELPPPDSDEVYAADLVGCAVFDQHGNAHGVVEALEAAGPQDLLQVTGGVLVPLALMKDVDLEAKRIVIDAPEGLFDLSEA